MAEAKNLEMVRREFLKKKLNVMISLAVLEAVIIIGITALMLFSVVIPDNDLSGLIFPGILAVIIVPVMIYGFKKVLGIDPSLKNIDPEKLRRLDEDVLTAPRYANSILCRDFLLVAPNRLCAIPYEDIVFIYGQNLTLTMYKVATVSTNSALIVVDKNHKIVALNGRTNAFSGNKGVFSTIDDRKVFETLQQRAPWSFFGYSKENSNLYATNFPEMVRRVQERKEQILADGRYVRP